jgi:hypothetical protein
MSFDWTISLGNILTVCGFCGAGVVFVMLMRTDMMLLGNRVTNIEGALRELVQSNIALAEMRGRFQTMDERVNMISERLDTHINSTGFGHRNSI